MLCAGIASALVFEVLAVGAPAAGAGRWTGRTVDETQEIVRAILGRNAQQGIALPDGSFAWSSLQCLQIIESLESTKVAVVEGEFFRAEPIGLVPAYAGWTCERAPQESATDYAARSRELAAAKVREFDGDVHVVLRLFDQQGAA
jgi:hypothetical protein